MPPFKVIALPRFSRVDPDEGPGPPSRQREGEWLLTELNLDYVRTAILPQLLNIYLGNGGKLDYHVEVVQRDDPANVIFQSDAGPANKIWRDSDASVPLFDAGDRALRPGDRRPPPFSDRMPPPGEGPGPGMRPPPQSGEATRMPPPGPPPPAAPPNGRWRMLVRHQAGSLEAVVARARWNNLAISLGVLFLILATAVALLRLSRRAQELAQAQINFVAGVSHELRTPITVIRTAAFNLRDNLARNPDQVERYGQLIQEQSQRLATLVDQILRFAGAQAGHVIRERAPAALPGLIDEALRSSRAGAPDTDVKVEVQLAPDLPVVLADAQALRHALQNLFDNALKYGAEGSNWIGVFVSAVPDADGPTVEIRVADRGPGIPREEQARIFDAFFRGRLAVRNQVHGAGLGLNLVKKIVEAHGGTLRVVSEPFQRTEFIIRIPAAPAERQHEFAHSLG